MDDINDNDLYNSHDKLSILKKKSYEDIYTRCVNTIKLTSKAGELMCIFQIPKFYINGSYPIIDIEKCASYVMAKLIMANKNINVTFHNPNILLIDWRKK